MSVKVAVLMCLAVGSASYCKGQDDAGNAGPEGRSPQPPTYTPKNQIDQCERMTVSMPYMKVSRQPLQQGFFRPLLPPQQCDGMSSRRMNPNTNGIPSSPSFHMYDLHKNHQPYYRQHVYLPKFNYPPTEAVCHMHRYPADGRMKVPGSRNRNEDPPSHECQTMEIQLPAGLPPRTVTRVGKLVNTINKSLLDVCQHGVNEGCLPDEDDNDGDDANKESQNEEGDNERQGPTLKNILRAEESHFSDDYDHSQFPETQFDHKRPRKRSADRSILDSQMYIKLKERFR